jgi:hypothetical protein
MNIEVIENQCVMKFITSDYFHSTTYYFLRSQIVTLKLLN